MRECSTSYFLHIGEVIHCCGVFEVGQANVDVEGGYEVLDFCACSGVAGVEKFDLRGETFFVFAVDNVKGLLGALDPFCCGLLCLNGCLQFVVGAVHLKCNLLFEFVVLGFEFAFVEFLLLGTGLFLKAVKEVPTQYDRCHPKIMTATKVISFAFKTVVVDEVDIG